MFAALGLCLVLTLPTAARGDEDGEKRGRSCRYVTPVWEKSDFGKPIVELSNEKRVSVSWNADEIILTGRSCIQAFEVEQQEFGRGRRRWSPWSSLVSCAIVLEGTENRRKSEFSCGKWLRSNDCGKRVRFRVLGHNIFNVERPRSSSTHEGVLIQCKNNIRGKRAFYVRAPHRKRYQKVERKSPETTRSKFKSARVHSDDEQDPPHMTTTATLLPGRYGSIKVKKEYEVRSNLRNFSDSEKELSHCAAYKVGEITDECDVQRQVQRTMEICLTSAKRLPLAGQGNLNRKKGRFKMMLDTECGGEMQLLSDRDCGKCEEDKTFIVI